MHDTEPLTGQLERIKNEKAFLPASSCRCPADSRFLMAATYTWSGASGTDLSWPTPGNWSPSGPPGTFDDANFSDLGSTNALGQPSSIATVNRTIRALRL